MTNEIELSLADNKDLRILLSSRDGFKPDILIQRRGDGFAVFVHGDERDDPFVSVFIPDADRPNCMCVVCPDTDACRVESQPYDPLLDFDPSHAG